MQGGGDQVGDGRARLRLDRLHPVGRNHPHGFEDRVVQTLRDRILHQSLLKLETGAGHGQILVAARNFRLGAHYVHGGNAFQLQLFFGVVEGLLREGKRLLIHLRLLIGADQVPIDVFDLGDGGDHLIFESDIGNFLVVARNSQIAQVRPESEAREQFLLKLKTKRGAQCRGQVEVNGCWWFRRELLKEKLMLVPVGKDCVKNSVHLSGIELQGWHSINLLVCDRGRLMLLATIEIEEWVVGRHGGSSAKRRLHQA